MSTNYDIDYNDQRFQTVESDKSAALDDVDKTYDGVISGVDTHIQDQINASKQWEETQKKNQQEQTDFAIEQINQQKAQAQKDYTKEQSGAYVDWQKQSNQYGANAEQMAAQGMMGTGYSESSQVSMYNTYQTRVTAARESYSRAVLNYDNAIKDARLQNNSALAEIAYNALKEQLQLSLQGFQYKNQLILEKADKKRAVENEYYARYQDVLKQINTENALAEDIRQFNKTMAEQQRQFDILHPQVLNGVKGDTSSEKYGPKKSGSSVVGPVINSGSSDTPVNKPSGKDYPVDTSSLVAAGLAGASASKIQAEIKAGRLVESVVNGKLTYKRVYNGTTANTKANYSSVVKNNKAYEQFKKTLKYRG